MNIQQRDRDNGITIAEALTFAPDDLKSDVVGLWYIVSDGRTGYGLSGNELREFVFLYIFALASHGAVVVDGAEDGVHLWRAVDRYGSKAEDIAYAVTAEWIGSGEPNIRGWEGIAFALPTWLESEENLKN